MKKVAQFFSKLLSFVLVLALLFSVYVFMAAMRAGKDKVPAVFGYSFLRVATGSMEPTIPVGTLVIMRHTEPDKVQAGDIICFYSTDPLIEGKPNTHRVAEVRNENGAISFITQGDASDQPDPYPVSPDRLVGVFVVSLQVGKLLDVIHSPYFFFFGLLLPLCAVAFLEFIHLKNLAEKKRENHAQDP